MVFDEPPPESNMIRKIEAGLQVPSMGEFTAAVADVAVSCGKKKIRGPPRTPKDHPLLLEASATRQARDAEQDPGLRHALGIRLVDLQHKLQAEIHHLKHDYLLKQGRVERSFKGERPGL